MEGEPQRPVWHFVCLLNLDSQNWANIEPKAPGNLLPSFCVLLPLPSKTKQSSQADRLIYRWVLQSSKSLTQKNAQFILRWIRKKNGELSEGRGINKHYIHDESKKVLKRVKPLYANLGESVCVWGGVIYHFFGIRWSVLLPSWENLLGSHFTRAHSSIYPVSED